MFRNRINRTGCPVYAESNENRVFGGQEVLLFITVHFENNRESSDEEEEEDIEDDEPNGDDEGLEGYDDELFAGPGLEGISLWDILGEGFLREASQLGMSFWYYYYYKF
jgi:hypothetical protein